MCGWCCVLIVGCTRCGTLKYAIRGGKRIGNTTTQNGASHKSRNRGWTSADRSTKATLMLTVPRSIVKSSTEDLTRPTFWTAVKYRVDPKAIVTPTPVEVNIVASSMDSDLEAFSHNPTDDSFAALAAQPTALPNIRTNGSSRTKLDYCRDNLSSILIYRKRLSCQAWMRLYHGRKSIMCSDLWKPTKLQV